MNTLIAVGTSAAYLYSLIVTFVPHLIMVKGLVMDVYFDTSAAIIVLILLGRFLEARAKGKTSEAIKKLIGLQPKTARVVRSGNEVDIPVGDVIPGISSLSGLERKSLWTVLSERVTPPWMSRWLRRVFAR